MAFWNRKVQNNGLKTEEYEELSKKIITFSTKLAEISAKIDLLDTQSRSLRGKLNQMIYKEDEEEDQSQPYKSPIPTEKSMFQPIGAKF